MKKQKKFMTSVLGVIAMYLVVITATADVTKGIGIEEKKPNIQKIEQQKEVDVPDSEKPHSTQTSKTTNEAQNTISDVEKTTEVSADNQVEESVKEAEEVTNNVVYAYTNKIKTGVFANPTDAKAADTLIKATRVEIVEAKDFESKKQSKVKKQDGTFEIKISTQVVNWTKVKYRKNMKDKAGWVKTEHLNDDIHKVIPKDMATVDFTPVKKHSYADNPKRNDVRGIYLTVYSASSDKKLDELIALTKRTPINAFVIDVKDDGGQLLFKTEAEKTFLGENRKNYPIKDVEKFMKKLKDNNIYTIARIVSFKDPRYAKKNPDKAIIKRSDGKPYTNSDGVIWVSAHDRNLWKYNVAVAKEAAEAGFDEIQFDYVRFPASNGGKLDKQLNYRNTENETKPATIQKYLKYARKELEPLNVYIAADVYGQVGSLSDDMGLGQHWETVTNEVDFICPMAYPSHYGKGVYGLSVPDANPYKTIYRSTLDGLNRNNNVEYPANVRPWLQAFTAKWVKGHISYGKNEIDAQTKALKDLGINEYLLWNPSNKYGIVEK